MSWTINIRGHDELLSKMERYSSQSEQVINTVLKEYGGKTAVSKITPIIPVSAEQARRGHRHAQSSTPLRVQYKNLGFVIRPKNPFDYLKYPDLGIGTSIKNQPKEFLMRGLDMAVDPIVTELLRGFDQLNNK